MNMDMAILLRVELTEFGDHNKIFMSKCDLNELEAGWPKPFERTPHCPAVRFNHV